MRSGGLQVLTSKEELLKCCVFWMRFFIKKGILVCYKRAERDCGLPRAFSIPEVRGREASVPESGRLLPGASRCGEENEKIPSLSHRCLLHLVAHSSCVEIVLSGWF